MHRKVVSIDPAPRKASVLYDGGFSLIEVANLAKRVDELAEDKATLLCWDAPLTGPADPSTPGAQASDFSYRPIERFFNRKDYGFKVPKGISVRPYSGCPHWAITKSLLGFPRLGRFELEQEKLPFALLSSYETLYEERACIVEIHPAVAIWLWCRENGDILSWRYKNIKKDQSQLRTLAIRLRSVWKLLQRPWLVPILDLLTTLESDKNGKADDKLDALVGWVLGQLYLEKNGDVVLLGNEKTGSLLLPNVKQLTEKFDYFCKEEERLR